MWFIPVASLILFNCHVTQLPKIVRLVHKRNNRGDHPLREVARGRHTVHASPLRQLEGTSTVPSFLTCTLSKRKANPH